MQEQQGSLSMTREDLIYSPNNCPHLWEEVSTSQGKKHTICVLCGCNKFLIEAWVSGKKRIRMSFATQHRMSFRLSERARNNVRAFAKDRGVSPSEIVEKFLFSLVATKAATTRSSEQLASVVYVVEKLVFTEWEPFECSCSRETAEEIVKTAGVDGQLRVVEYVPKKFLAALCEAVGKALSGEITAQKASRLRGAYGQAKGLLNRKLG